MRLCLVLQLIWMVGCPLLQPLDEHSCAPISKDTLAKLPAHLSETGLFANMSTETLSAGVQPYQPQFELWSDGATKRRWVKLPDGARIDSSDQDFWQFPEGT